MPDTKPSIILLHGDDLFGLQTQVKDMIAKMGDPGLAELNTARLDGRTVSAEELQTATQSLPFLAERRLVILNQPAVVKVPEPQRARFKALLDAVPASTALVLVVEDEIQRKDWAKLNSKHWLRVWVEQAGARAFYKEVRPPAPQSMPKWIIDLAREKGGQFERPAAELLADYIGTDTSVATLEVEKLLNYVDYRRPVEVEDVQSLTSANVQADIFTLVDAMSRGESAKSLRELEILLQEQDPFSLFGMIVRQFRLLIQARDVLDDGGTARELAQLGVNPYVADKTIAQARRFSLERLVGIYHRLLEIDEQVKTSQMPFQLALETFLAEV